MQRPPLTSLLSIILLHAAVAVQCTGGQRRTEFESVEKFFRVHCTACHDSATRTAEFAIPQISTNAQHLPVTQAWEQIVRKLRSRQMPPQDHERPTEEEYDSVVNILENAFDQAAAASPAPGRTETFRRLTRTEYQNAIRDLLAVEIDVSTLLPKDEVSHGFDNVTVSELTPTLLNRYLSAARLVSQLAVGRGTSDGIGRTFRIRPDITQEDHLSGLPPGTRGGVLIPFHFPHDGRYTITARLMRDRNEHVEGLHQTHQLEFSVDRKRVSLFSIKRPRSEGEHTTADRHLTATVPISAGPHDIAVTFIRKPVSLIETRRQPYNARFNFHRSPRQSPALYEVSISSDGASDPQGPAETPSRQRIFVCRPDTPDDFDSCAKQILSSLMTRAYRRTVTAPDLEQPMQFFHRGAAEGGFEAGIQDALAAILVNPNFVFRIEREPAGVEPGKPYQISDFELASRLSFFLWSSLPDDRLLQLARDGRLSQKSVIRDQVRRMLQDERAQTLATRFASQWLYLRNLETITPDGRLFPDFDHNLRDAFRSETELFFQSIMEEDRSVLELLKADYTFVNERLAKHYGIPHIYGSRFRRVQLDPQSRRGGLLRQASVLTVTSYATRTSPVVRGNWILQNLVGAPPPPPPDDVPDLKDNTVDSRLSVRERLALHRANPACAACHNLMDPIGFALENFDAVGRWRDLEEGRPIDASGGFAGSLPFQGVDGLEQALLKRPELFVGTLTEKLLTYALGRGIEYYDGPAVRSIVRNARADAYRFSDIIEGIVLSPPFQMRTAR